MQTEKITVTIHADSNGGFKAGVKSSLRVSLLYVGKRFASEANCRGDAENWLLDSGYNLAGVRFVTVPV